MPAIDNKIAHKVADALSEAALNMRDMNGLLIQPLVTDPRVIYQIALASLSMLAGHPIHVTGERSDSDLLRVPEHRYR